MWDEMDALISRQRNTFKLFVDVMRLGCTTRAIRGIQPRGNVFLESWEAMMRHHDPSPSLGILLSIFLIPALACVDPEGVPGRDAAVGLPGGSVDASVLEVLEWRPIGPWRGGKSIAGAGHPTEPGVFYMGSTNGGGVWKTDDAGVSWHNLSDGYFGTTTVSSLAISESDPEILYVGTGDVSFRTNISRGDGLYRSSDGGRSWENMGLADTRNLSAIEVHPHDTGSRLRRLARTRVHSGRESRPVSLPRRRRDVGARPLHRR